MGKKKDKTESTEPKRGGGRQVSEATAGLRAMLEKMAKRKNGVTNTEFAAEAEITTAKASAIARPLVKSGAIEMTNESNRVTYTKAAASAS